MKRGIKIMDENARALLQAVMMWDFKLIGDDRLTSDYLYQMYGILAVDLGYGNNRAIYERGLLLREKINTEFNDACKELNIKEDMEMNELTLSGLLRMSNSHYVINDAKWLVIKVEVNGNAPEIIINPKANFETKLDYYSKAYNEDLTLKSNPSIKIVYYDFVEDIHACLKYIS
jgi:hypothetical protein